WRCYGAVRPGASGLEIYRPELQTLDKPQTAPLDTTPTPIYPATEGLPQPRLRALSAGALGWLAQGNSLQELLPEDLVARYRMPPLREASRVLHRRPPDVDLQALQEGRHWAQHRLAFEELLAHQLTMRRLRAEVRSLRAPVVHA